MTNPVRGEAALRLDDGRTFTLVADYEALITAEAVYGKPLGELMSDGKAGFTGAIRALLYGVMRAYHPEVTPSAAAELFMTHSETVSAALTLALNLAFPEADPEAEGKERAHPPGKSSGASGAKQGSTRKGSGGPRRARSI